MPAPLKPPTRRQHLATQSHQKPQPAPITRASANLPGPWVLTADLSGIGRNEFPGYWPGEPDQPACRAIQATSTAVRTNDTGNLAEVALLWNGTTVDDQPATVHLRHTDGKWTPVRPWNRWPAGCPRPLRPARTPHQSTHLVPRAIRTAGRVATRLGAFLSAGEHSDTSEGELVASTSAVHRLTPYETVRTSPVNWETISGPDRIVAWRELFSFVERIVVRYNLGFEIMPCWWRHGDAVEDLTALWHVRQITYSQDAKLNAAMSWTDVLYKSRDRLRDIFVSCRDHHVDSTVVMWMDNPTREDFESFIQHRDTQEGGPRPAPQM